MIGLFPTENECIEYGLNEDAPVWLPSDGGILTNAIAKNMQSLSNWIGKSCQE